MKTNKSSPEQYRKGIFYLLLPVLVIPLLFGLSWVLFPVQAETNTQATGLNTALPAPQLKAEKQSKAAAYEFQEKATRQPDSWELPALYQMGDFLGDHDNEADAVDADNGWEETEQFGSGIPSKFIKGKKESPVNKTGLDKKEELIEKQLQSLDALLGNQALGGFSGNTGAEAGPGVSIKAALGLDLDDGLDLEKEQTPELVLMKQMMEDLETSAQQPDAQLEQLSALMDKLLLIQNPALGEQFVEPSIVKEKRAFPALKEKGVDVGGSPFGFEETQGLNQGLEAPNVFFGLNDPGTDLRSSDAPTTFSAVIPRTQQLYPGEVLELKLEESMWVDGMEIPAGTSLFGTTSLSGNRLQVSIPGILWDKHLLPLDLKVYSTDAIAGLPVHAKSSGAQLMEEGSSELQSIGILGMGMDWQAQVANSGIQATKGLFKSKSRAKQLTLKAGHPVLLVNAKSGRV